MSKQRSENSQYNEAVSLDQAYADFMARLSGVIDLSQKPAPVARLDVSASNTLMAEPAAEVQPLLANQVQFSGVNKSEQVDPSRLSKSELQSVNPDKALSESREVSPQLRQQLARRYENANRKRYQPEQSPAYRPTTPSLKRG